LFIDPTKNENTMNKERESTSGKRAFGSILNMQSQNE
jgi:hypothetical protein